MMKNSKRVLSLILAITMIFTALSSTGALALAAPNAENNHSASTTDEIEQYTPSVGWNYVNEGWYYYDSNLNMVKGTWMADSVGWCYLGSDGRMLTDTWMADSWGWCYLGSDGRMLKNSWAKDSTGWCYLDEYGYMVSNTWKMDSVGWCYIDGSGHMVSDTWMADSWGWCYLGSDGRMLKNGWAKDSTGWCYLDEYGYIVYNTWAIDSYDWTYIDNTGHMSINAWVMDSMGWCYMGSNGYIVRQNWVCSGGYWYFMDPTGHMTKGWRYVDNSGYYYFYDNGNMAVNTTIDGCYIDSNGRYNTNQSVNSLKLNQRFLDYVNAERLSVGAGKLAMNNYLNGFAEIRSGELDTLFDHKRPNGTDCSTVVDKSKYNWQCFGENIFNENITGEYPNFDELPDGEIDKLAHDAFIGFKNSPNHYSNMIDNDFEETGIGVYTVKKGNVTYFYLTHLFGTQL